MGRASLHYFFKMCISNRKWLISIGKLVKTANYSHFRGLRRRNKM